MKKLIIAAAIVCAAVVSQAAALKWSANNIYQVGSTTAKAGSSYIALCFISADSTGTATTWSMDDAIAAIQNGSIKLTDAATTKSPSVGILTSSAVSHTEWNADTEGGTPGATVKAFAIIVDSKTVDANGYLTGVENYMVLGEKTYTFSGSETYTLAYDSQAANTWNAVPEPTSGLLLLLGVAGLALRRRRA